MATLREWPRGAVVVFVLVALYYLLPLDGRAWWLGVAAGLLAVVALAPLAVRQVGRVMRSARPLREAIGGLAVLLALLVLGFATTYYSLDEHDPGQVEGLETKTDALYLSMAIVSTVGFGDVHPADQAARGVAVGQMAADVVAIAVVARLVTSAAKQRFESMRPGEPSL